MIYLILFMSEKNYSHPGYCLILIRPEIWCVSALSGMETKKEERKINHIFVSFIFVQEIVGNQPRKESWHA